MIDRFPFPSVDRVKHSQIIYEMVSVDIVDFKNVNLE